MGSTAFREATYFKLTAQVYKLAALNLLVHDFNKAALSSTSWAEPKGANGTRHSLTLQMHLSSSKAFYLMKSTVSNPKLEAQRMGGIPSPGIVLWFRRPILRLEWQFLFPCRHLVAKAQHSRITAFSREKATCGCSRGHRFCSGCAQGDNGTAQVCKLR